MASPNRFGSTGTHSQAEQLRADVDSGRTGDKVAYPDPAAAPLGADDEAAATPSRQVAGDNMQAESAQQSEARKGTPSGNPATLSRSWIYIAGTVAVLIVLLLLGTMIPYQSQ